ncbi:MAG TPA: GRP family sugar transporter [Anaerolineales bacterium]|nr:GRP family sugar transporter [Anaerolineales bacterium]HMV95830.1 GRP family sugar transporter [Anaerolineales bacterium]HMX19817.1 GRP family sugar transporter [Anaerolineales bacterium]HMX75875.1 GRP family sugar transporter [Anaerolineales bacterium]HNA54811.1 GRP family sugar transporter [Anaerolineales bacterium]
MLSIFLGLLAALGWGAGDFTGGIASRKTGAYRTVFYGELIGVFALFLVIAIISEPIPDLRSWLFAMLAGALGTLGLILLYHAMAIGVMSIAAPVSALLAAALPVVVGIFREGLPAWTTFIGFGFALFAVWMISQGEGGVTDIFSHLADLKLPLIAGIGFGSYFVFMHEATSTGSTIWPMVASRSGGMILITIYMLIVRAEWKVEDRSAWPIIVLNGILDISGNVFFILAGQMGRLDVAAVLSSLFPGTTVMLAWIFLKERLSPTQWIGIASALTAIVLMTI